MSPARYIMVGGFLGAGKTTAILRMAEALDGRGHRVGLITNDQSVGLVDTTMLAAHGFPVEEITGGCFCCRFNSLVDAAERLTAGTRPDVFIAEPVGSCTDLRASVSYPLRRMYGERLHRRAAQRRRRSRSARCGPSASSPAGRSRPRCSTSTASSSRKPASSSSTRSTRSSPIAIAALRAGAGPRVPEGPRSSRCRPAPARASMPGSTS